MSIQPPVLQVFDLSKSYARGPEQVHALVSASLTIPPGELYALVGPSGSGKTTLLNLLCGWEEPDSGKFVWKGIDTISSPRDLAWDQVAVVPQSLGLLEELTIRENIELPGRLGHGGRGAMSERVETLIGDLGLTELATRLPAEVSLGEQQRAALARALVSAPALLLADEPTGHQDSVWARGVMRALRNACSEGTACLVATHNPEVLRYVDRIFGIRDGRLGDVPEETALRTTSS
ncbi:MAG: putative transport system ATP-binding protein [Actinomycetota bacterium]|jgi:putative ABC transport system ATP-binding protein|nr:putative transport system ATP-binding protein [Actinomycetota bacterium]